MKHIKNTISIIESNTSDIIINIYYLSSNSCRIITRQFDLPFCEKLELKIDDEHVVINPFIQLNDIILQHTVLEEVDDYDRESQLIPKIIIQTSETYTPTNAMTSLIDFNPEYEYKFFNEIQRREFLKNTFTQKIVDAYDILVPGAFKADLFRYGYLFIHGGCYFDDKIIARECLRNIIKPEDTLLLCEDVESESILNAVIMTAPKNFLFLKLLLSACDRILESDMSDMLLLTGPKLMYKVFKEFILENNMRFKHYIINSDFSSYKNFLILDKSSKVIFTKTTKEALNKFCHDPDHYRQLWNRNEIFYKNKVVLYNLAVLVYPNPYVDSFKFTVDYDEMTIERADCPDIWHFNLRLKIINTETSESKFVEAGFNRIVPVNFLRLKENVFLSSTLKVGDITFDDEKTVVITCLRNYQKKANEVVILCETSHLSNENIDMGSNDFIVFFTGSDAVYQCSEKNTKAKEIYITEVLLSILSQNYSHIKLIFSDNNLESESMIPKKNINHFITNLQTLLKKNEIDFYSFCENYKEVDIQKIYNQTIELSQNFISDLNDIIKTSGELLEGNVFYEHHCQDFNIHNEFQNKRYNLFYHGKLALDILEIGFNAGHSALLYLIANPYSKIHFFDLGEHKYSRACFDYLNSKFPGRLSVVWGDSTITMPQTPDRLYDFIHIDGGHTRIVAESDFYNCKSLAKKNALVMIDDYNGNCLHTFCNQLIKYRKIQKHNLLYHNNYHLLCSYI